MSLAVLLAGISAVFAVTALAVAVPERRFRTHRFPGAERGGGSLVRALGGLGLRSAAARRRPPQRDLELRIRAAGRPLGLGTREILSAKLASAVCGGALGVLFGAVAPGRLGIALVLTGPVAGFFGPDLWLRRRAAERFRRVRRELPDALDLLRVTVEAGHSLGAALASVAARSEGTLAGEWRITAAELELGIPLGRALDGFVERLPLPEIEALRGALDRADRHGAPLAGTLAAQAREARLARRRRVNEEAAKAGPKIQLVVALLLVPSVLLMVAAALVGAMLGGGGGGGEGAGGALGIG